MAGWNQTVGGGGFHHLGLRVSNYEKSIKFYTEVLGMKIAFDTPHPWEPEVDHITFIDTGDGNFFEIFNGAKESSAGFDEYRAGTFFHVGFRSNNVDAVAERARKAGVKILLEPVDVHLLGRDGSEWDVRATYLEGPDGEQVEFLQEK